MIVEIVTSFTTHILVLENHVPCHLLDGFSIGEASRVSGKAKFALESLSCMLLLHMPYSLSLNNLHNYIIKCLFPTYLRSPDHHKSHISSAAPPCLLDYPSCSALRGSDGGDQPTQSLLLKVAH